MIAALIVSLALAPAPAPPAPAPTPLPSPTASPPPDPLAEAQALHLEATARYDLGDYEGAISRWLAAAALISDDWRLARLIYNLAEAHRRAYEVGRDPAHLRSARDLYTRFLADVQRLDHGKESLSTDVAGATVHLERIGRRLADLDARDVVERELLQQIAANTLRHEPTPRTRALRGVGVGFTAAGVTALGLMTAGLVLGRQYEDLAGLAANAEDERRVILARGERANHLAIAGAVLGASFLAVGVPTLAVGLVRARRERDEARQHLRPLLAPDRVGLVWEGRF